MAKRLEDTGFALYELLVEAAFQEEKYPKLHQADVTLQKLKFYLRLSHDCKLTGDKQYEHASRLLVEIGKLLGGWVQKEKHNDAQTRPRA